MLGESSRSSAAFREGVVQTAIEESLCSAVVANGAEKEWANYSHY